LPLLAFLYGFCWRSSAFLASAFASPASRAGDFFIGILSLVIIVVSGLFVGMVLGLQGYETLVDYGTEESLGVLVALSLLRELGPVVTALLLRSLQARPLPQKLA